MSTFAAPGPRPPYRRRACTVLIATSAAAAAVLSLTGCEDANATAGRTTTTTAASTTTTLSAAPAASTVPATTLATDQILTVSPDEAATQALAQLETLPVKGRAPKTGYERAMFGQAWTDDVTVDGGRNGCDTRNDILRRDLVDITIKPGSNNCTVLTGTLHDTYTGQAIAFTRGEGTSSAVQIDHVVALSDAWQKGAQQLDEQARRNLANDPLNLQAVDGPTNGQKSDGDAATWLPPNKSYRCPYVTRQVQVKAKYNLWVTQAEKDAIARVLSDCGAAPTPAAPVPAPAVAAPAPTVAPPAPAPASAPPVQQQPHAPAPAPLVAPAPAPVPSGAGVSYANCAAARAAGAAPIYAGQPGYSSKLDRDGDGIACE